MVFGHSMGGTVGVYLTDIRGDLVTKLVLAESNLFPGGGVGTKWITSFSEETWIDNEYPKYIKKLRGHAREGDSHSTLIYALWRDADPRGIYLSALSLVTLPDTFHKRFYDLKIPRYFIYGEENFPTRSEEATPDTPDPEELQQYGIEPVVLPKSGHFMPVDNLQGFINVLHNCLSKTSKRR